MTSVELYINNQLCDIDNPNKLGIRLNKQLIQPTTTTTKNIQYSFSITLPTTPTNNKIFKYGNVEEVKNKFNYEYVAECLVDGIRIFKGYFMIQSITEDNYKGNLYIPQPKSIKDIFGDRPMTQPSPQQANNVWDLVFPLPMDGGYTMAQNISRLNRDAVFNYQQNFGINDCMFPYVLYGLIPKNPMLPDEYSNGEVTGKYTPKNIYDSEFSLMGMEDLPPSMNVLRTVKKMFEVNGLNIGGSAFEDVKLNNLYMSYSNPTDYEQKWNWGDLAGISFDGRYNSHDGSGGSGTFSWVYQKAYSSRPSDATIKSDFPQVTTITRGAGNPPSTGTVGQAYVREYYISSGNRSYSLYLWIQSGSSSTFSNLEAFSYEASDEWGKYYAIDLFKCKRMNLYNIVDKNGNISINNYEKSVLPTDGSIREPQQFTNVHITIPKSGYYKVNLKLNNFQINNTNTSTAMRGYSGARWCTAASNNGGNNTFARSMYELQVLRDFGDGQFNDAMVGRYNNGNFGQPNGNVDFVKYYPMAGKTAVIDPKNNQNFICGFHFGRHDHNGEDDYNPQDTSFQGNAMVIKNGWSWDVTFSQKQKIFSVYNSRVNNSDNNYWAYGDNPDTTSSSKEYWAVPQRIGYLNGMPENNSGSNGVNQGSGQVETIIWLDKGEHITVKFIGSMGDYKWSGTKASYDQWSIFIDDIDFHLDIIPFNTNMFWNNFDNNGNYNYDNKLEYNSADYSSSGFLKQQINLIDFLPSEIKCNDFIDNLCKAFNLTLYSTDINSYNLDVLQTESSIFSNNPTINLDDKTSIIKRTNEPLGLPSQFQIGFTVDQEEEGYSSSHPATIFENQYGFDGGGTFDTGTVGGTIQEQKSIFSYNWFKWIYLRSEAIENEDQWEEYSDTYNGLPSWHFPVISKNEVWVNDQTDYAEMQKKWFVNKGLRFWYIDRLVLNGTSIYNPFYIGYNGSFGNQVTLMSVADNLPTDPVNGYQNAEPGAWQNRLDYLNDNTWRTILNNYFTIISTNDSNYTTVEVYLTPYEYSVLNGYTDVILNGDVYYVSQIDGYDPVGNNPTKLKLIRKIIK